MLRANAPQVELTGGTSTWLHELVLTQYAGTPVPGSSWERIPQGVTCSQVVWWWERWVWGSGAGHAVGS